MSRVLPDMAVSLEHEVLTLREQVVHLLADNTHLKAQLQEVLTLVGQLRGTIAKQEDHIAKLVKMTFGRKSERVEGPTLFDDLPDEPVVPPPPVVPEPVVLVPKRKGHGRKHNPANLPRHREEIDLSEAEKVCPSGPTRINFACFSGVFETEARVNRSQNKVRFADSLGNQAN